MEQVVGCALLCMAFDASPAGNPLQEQCVRVSCCCRVNGRALVPGTLFFEMALAALSSVRGDTSAPLGALTAASIAAPCILGSTTAWPTLDSSPSMLLCSIASGNSADTLEVSSPDADAAQKSASHLKASAAMVLSSRPQPLKARPQTTARMAFKETNIGEPVTRQLAILAGIGSPHRCESSDGYTVHPAAADSSLHLGAVPGTKFKGPSRVPVGFGAYKAGIAGEASALCRVLAICCPHLQSRMEVLKGCDCVNEAAHCRLWILLVLSSVLSEDTPD